MLKMLNVKIVDNVEKHKDKRQRTNNTIRQQHNTIKQHNTTQSNTTTQHNNIIINY